MDLESYKLSDISSKLNYIDSEDSTSSTDSEKIKTSTMEEVNFENCQSRPQCSTPDLVSTKFNLFSIKKKTEKRFKTALIYLSMICLGMSTAITGPTLLALQRAVQSDIDTISTIYLGRSAGYLFGALCGGLLLDRFKKPQGFILILNITMAICTITIPWCKNIGSLITDMVISGLAMGALDTGLNVWCLNLWKNQGSPLFQALHFCFGLGAFIAPIIAAPFLVIKETETLKNNTNITIDPLYQSNEQLNVTIVYGIIGLVSILTSLLYLFLFLTSVEMKSSTENLKYNNPKKVYLYAILTLSFLCLGIYCGLEIGFGQMIAVYVVKSNYKFTEFLASVIVSLYWGTFTFSRGVSILLAVKFQPVTIIAFDCCIMLVSAIILFYFASNEYCLWFGTSFIGFGFASFFPSIIIWVGQYVNITNKIGSGFIITASLGEMIAPLAIGQYINTNPKFLLYFTMTGVGICSALSFSLYLILSVVGFKKIDRNPQQIDSFNEEQN